MPFADRWGLTITKTSAGVYDISRAGETVTVHVHQAFPDEAINTVFALLRGIQQLEPNDPTWQRRYEYAVARWKLLSYQALIDAAPANQRAPIRAKRDVWVSDEARLRTILGTDA